MPPRMTLAVLGRALLISPFMLEAQRLLQQWGDQVWYLETNYTTVSSLFLHFFLVSKVLLCTVGSLGVAFNSHAELALCALLLDFAFNLVVYVPLVPAGGASLFAQLFLLTFVGGLGTVFIDTLVPRRPAADTSFERNLLALRRTLPFITFLAVIMQDKLTYAPEHSPEGLIDIVAGDIVHCYPVLALILISVRWPSINPILIFALTALLAILNASRVAWIVLKDSNQLWDSPLVAAVMGGLVLVIAVP